MIDLLTPQEVADQLRTSTAALAQMRRRGNGPQFVKCGSTNQSKVLYRREDVENWVESRLVEHR